MIHGNQLMRAHCCRRSQEGLMMSSSSGIFPSKLCAAPFQKAYTPRILLATGCIE